MTLCEKLLTMSDLRSKAEVLCECYCRNTFIDSLVFSFKRVAIVTAAIAVILLSNNLIQADDISLESALGLEEISVVDAYDPIYLLAME